ncbi:hypothetical protein BAZOLSSOX_313 [uncultured Gammaproteobacteria bacterium]|nr:hypothetical protein BAZOLSSOX_313 [uncultured Gammaproteobacteria bacterium]
MSFLLLTLTLIIHHHTGGLEMCWHINSILILIHHHTGGLESGNAKCWRWFYYSPPHRWLRKKDKEGRASCLNSPPHRWLRKSDSTQTDFETYSPPHRWLRNSIST